MPFSAPTGPGFRRLWPGRSSAAAAASPARWSRRGRQVEAARAGILAQRPSALQPAPGCVDDGKVLSSWSNRPWSGRTSLSAPARLRRRNRVSERHRVTAEDLAVAWHRADPRIPPCALSSASTAAEFAPDLAPCRRDRKAWTDSAAATRRPRIANRDLAPHGWGPRAPSLPLSGFLQDR
jgi:hypothetical protein